MSAVTGAGAGVKGRWVWGRPQCGRLPPSPPQIDNAGPPPSTRAQLRLSGCVAVYTYAARRIWKCKGCSHQFSVTSGTIFASRKLPIRDYLVAIILIVNAVKGISALQLDRDLDVQYKMAFFLAHKIREAIQAEQAGISLSGVVEVDGAYFGGHFQRERRRSVRSSTRQLVERGERHCQRTCFSISGG